MLKFIKRRKEKNIDKIRKMDVDELADVFDRITDYCPKYQNDQVYCAETSCKSCIANWLNAEVE